MAVAGALALAAALAASLAVGTTPIPLGRTLSAFTAYDGSNEHVVVLSVRLPRALLGAAVGVALGVAGALMQALSRNPLAEPGVLGISWGAALAVVVAQVLVGIHSIAALASVALLGAGVAGLVVLALGSLGRDGLMPAKLVIAGAAVSSLLSGVLQGILAIDQESLEASRRWLAGSLVDREMSALVQVLPFLAAGLAIALLLARPLTALALGDDVARGLGQRPGLVKGAAGLAVILLAGAAVAVAGPLMLVGLAVPHLARALVGGDYRRLIPLAALLGAVLVVAADVVARVVIPPEEIPVGVMTALVGAPVFIQVARRGLSAP